MGWGLANPYADILFYEYPIQNLNIRIFSVILQMNQIQKGIYMIELVEDGIVVDTRKVGI